MTCLNALIADVLVAQGVDQHVTRLDAGGAGGLDDREVRRCGDRRVIGGRRGFRATRIGGAQHGGVEHRIHASRQRGIDLHRKDRACRISSRGLTD